MKELITFNPPPPPVGKEFTHPCHAELVSASNKQKFLFLSKHFPPISFFLAQTPHAKRKKRVEPKERKDVGFLPPGKFLSEICPLASLCSRSQRRVIAFTLAEVLITLAITGVVAALTIPSVVKNYQKTQTVTQLKKVYSALANTTNLAITNEGPVSTWDLNGEYGEMSQEFADKYLIPYLKVAKNCGTRTSAECKFEKIPMNYNAQYNYSFGSTFARFYLTDGTLIALVTNTYYASRQYAEIWIDINGQKKPNMMGKDIFRFEYWIKGNGTQYDGKFLPHGFGNSRQTLMSGSGVSEGCNKDALGYFCTALILLDGWQIKDDYPW